jgi:hypothetical protein
MSKYTVSPFVSKTENGYLQTGFALLQNGYWMTRSSGSHIWAMSEARALELAVKVGGKSATTPTAFVGWGVHVKATAVKAAPVVAAGPFANLPATVVAAPVVIAAPVVAAPTAGVVQAASAAAAAAPKKPRSVAQCAATLKLTSSNALKCERGEIGGDIAKARKAVATAFASYATACKAAGVEMDGDLVDNARFAAGFDDLADDAALGE